MRKMSWNTFKVVLLFAILTLVFGIVLIEQCKAQSNPTIDTPYLTVRSWLKVDSIYVVGGVRGTGLDSTWVSGEFGSLVIDDSLRNEGTFRQKGLSTFGATSTPVTISAAGKVTATDTVVSTNGFRTEGASRLKGIVTMGATATPVTVSTAGKITATDTVVSHKGLRIGPETTTDDVVPKVVLKGDADSDGSAVTSEALTLTLTSNASPTLAKWDFTSTQSNGFRFDRAVGVGSASLPYSSGLGLDLAYGGANALLIGADNNFWSRTNNTTKIGRIGSYHYTNAATALCALQTKVGFPSASTAELDIGGGTSVLNAFTHIYFYTAANNTTVTGTQAMSINDVQFVGLGTSSAGAKLEIHGDKMTDTLFTVCNDRIHTASYDTLFAVTSGGSVARNGATDFKRVVSLLDEGEYVMPTGIAGFGQCKATLAWVFFHFESDGTVTLEDHVNGSTTNGNDATLNVYDAGEGIVIENQLGGTLNVLIDITYYTP